MPVGGLLGGPGGESRGWGEGFGAGGASGGIEIVGWGLAVARVKSGGQLPWLCLGRERRCGEFEKNEEDVDAHEKQAHGRESSGPGSNLLVYLPSLLEFTAI